jgi:hypothetical protein
MDIICTLIASKTTEIIYTKNQGEGFERPSFFITYISSNTEDINHFAYNNNIMIQIVYFAPFSDDYKNVNSEAQYAMNDTLKNIFKNGYFKMGDRAIKINKMSGGPRDAEIYLTLDLDLTDDRNIPEDSPITQEVNLNI